MSEQKNSFLYIGENGKADWGVPEGYPKKIEDKTIIFEETTLEFTYQGLEQGTRSNYSVAFIKNNTYIVNFNGTEYTYICKIYHQPISNNDVFCLGNPKYGYNIIKETNIDTGEPFLITYTPGYPYYEFRGPNKGFFTFSIIHDKSKIYTIDQNFLPGAIILYLDSENYLYKNQTDTTDTSKRLTYTQVRDMLLSGQNLILELTNEDDSGIRKIIVRIEYIGIMKNKENNEYMSLAFSLNSEFRLVPDIKF